MNPEGAIAKTLCQNPLEINGEIKRLEEVPNQFRIYLQRLQNNRRQAKLDLNTGVQNMALKVQNQAHGLRTKQGFDTVALNIPPAGLNQGFVALT
jgi:hypothetical protein